MHRCFTPVVAALFAAQPVLADQYVLELGAALEPPPAELMSRHGVTLDETLSTGADSYAVFSARDAATLMGFLLAAAIRPIKISEVLFVNSPAVGGGEAPDPDLRPGHQVYVIERPIPGVGFLGLERKQAISANSNEAIATLGDIIEWDRSYLTSEGTYCVYRADSPQTLREHGALAGAPIGRITAVTQQIH